MATQLNPRTTERLTGWKSLEPNHRKLITSNKMAAVTKIGVSSLGTEKEISGRCTVTIVPTRKNDCRASSNECTALIVMFVTVKSGAGVDSEGQRNWRFGGKKEDV